MMQFSFFLFTLFWEASNPDEIIGRVATCDVRHASHTSYLQTFLSVKMEMPSWQLQRKKRKQKKSKGWEIGDTSTATIPRD